MGIFDGRHRALSKFITGMDKVPGFGVPKNTSPSPLPFEDRSIHVTDTLNSLATIYIRQGKLREAGELLQRVQAIERRAYGLYHPDVARTQNNYTLLYRARGDVWRALEAQRMASEVIETDLRRRLLAGSERQMQAYVELFAAQTDAALSLNLQSAPHEAEATKTAVTFLLRYKGRVLDAMSGALARLRRQADPESKALLNQFAAARAQLAELSLNGFDKKDAEGGRARAQRLEDEMERIEIALMDRSVEFRDKLRAHTLEVVQAQIPAQAALIEFALYRPSDAKSLVSRPPRYAAYVVPAKGQPRAVDLGEASSIDRAVADLRQALRDSENEEVKRPARALDELIMRPLRGLLSETRELLVSPDGALNLAPFAALVDEHERYLVERYSITYLTSGRDLVRLQDRAPSRQEALIIADPDFGPRTAQIADRMRTSSGVAAMLAQADFTPLPGAAEEATALHELLPQATALTREQATETAVKQATAPRILHIATHGFFLAAAPESEATTRGQRLLLQQKSDGSTGAISPIEDPLLRSGLALAGVNARQSGDDDGILTAYEAAALDLWGTRLIVLSACDTGVGEVKNSSGVYGLRRALALAGAETLVMSLWPVSDRGTRDLMIEYYKALQTGQGRSEAMRQAQLGMLKDEKRRHPYFWASFIVSGEWANLDGKR
jgi:CHAT domain-containing protein